MRLWWIGIQNEAFLLVSHDIMVSTFKIGGNRRFFGVCTANFVRCRGGARAIPVPVVSHIPVADVTAFSRICRFSSAILQGLLLQGIAPDPAYWRMYHSIGGSGAVRS